MLPKGAMARSHSVWAETAPAIGASGEARALTYLTRTSMLDTGHAWTLLPDSVGSVTPYSSTASIAGAAYHTHAVMPRTHVIMPRTRA